MTDRFRSGKAKTGNVGPRHRMEVPGIALINNIQRGERNMKQLKVRLTFTEKCLGTANNNPDIHRDFIASKAPDAVTREEEIEAIGAEEYEEKQMTVFPRLDGGPMFWDYQIKGFFKDTCSALQRCKGEDFSKETCKIKAYKKVIDGCIFVEPRKIPIDMHGGEMGYLQRPLRGQTAQGERIALATSETIPAGSTIDIAITCLSDSHVNAVIEWLNYGKWKGIGQWRNASFGRFTYELMEMA